MSRKEIKNLTIIGILTLVLGLILFNPVTSIAEEDEYDYSEYVEQNEIDVFENNEYDGGNEYEDNDYSDDYNNDYIEDTFGDMEDCEEFAVDAVEDDEAGKVVNADLTDDTNVTSEEKSVKTALELLDDTNDIEEKALLVKTEDLEGFENLTMAAAPEIKGDLLDQMLNSKEFEEISKSPIQKAKDEIRKGMKDGKNKEVVSSMLDMVDMFVPSNPAVGLMKDMKNIKNAADDLNKAKGIKEKFKATLKATETVVTTVGKNIPLTKPIVKGYQLAKKGIKVIGNFFAGLFS